MVKSALSQPSTISANNSSDGVWRIGHEHSEPWRKLISRKNKFLFIENFNFTEFFLLQFILVYLTMDWEENFPDRDFNIDGKVRWKLEQTILINSLPKKRVSWFHVKTNNIFINFFRENEFYLQSC